MNKYIEISNKTEIPLEAFTLIGASSKRNQSGKIGYFGSGLKYAIARLLRSKVETRIFSGSLEIVLTTKEEKFRDTTIHKIVINGVETNMTTEMGPDWTLWGAIREIYCNAIDEGDYIVRNVEEENPEEGKTKIYIQETKEVKKIIENWDRYFTSRRRDSIVSKGDVQIFNSLEEDIILYRKGIRAIEKNTTFSSRRHLFDYNLNFEINESRVVKYGFMAKIGIRKALALLSTKEMVERIFKNPKSFEANLGWSGEEKFNENWIEVINGRSLVSPDLYEHYKEELKPNTYIVLNYDLIEALKECFGDRVYIFKNQNIYEDFVVIKKTELQERKIKASIEFLSNSNIKINSNIEVVKSRDRNLTVLGSVKSETNTILITEKAFEGSIRLVISTLLEEHLHLKSSAGDKTRNFQSFILSEFINLMEYQNDSYII